MFKSISKHKISLAILDVVIIFVGFTFSFWYVFSSGLYHKPRPYPIYFVPSVLLISIILLIVFQLEGLYKYQAITRPLHQSQLLLKCFLKVMAAFILIVFFMKTKYIADSRLTIGLGFLTCYFLMVLVRSVIVSRVFYAFIKRGIIRKRTIIVGAGSHGRMVYRHLKNNPKNYFDIVGFSDDDAEKIGTQIDSNMVSGSSYDMASLAKKYKAKEVILAISNIEKGALLDLVDRCKEAGLVIHIISDLLSKVNEKMEAEEFGGFVTYRIIPKHPEIVRLAIKRLIDLVGSSILLLLFSPLFLIIAWSIKRDSGRPIFYKNKVAGKGGKTFWIYKFRSMIHDSTSNKEDMRKYEEGKKDHMEFMKNFIQGNFRGDYFVKNEPRITKVGHVLRKYSLDELPQLINVFMGNMSLVGPRFASVTEYSFYKPWHKRRLQVKPGLTGLWQVRGRSEVSYDDMVMLDLYYIENWSIFLDLEVLLRTIPVVLFGKGGY